MNKQTAIGEQRSIEKVKKKRAKKQNKNSPQSGNES
jgi:hypothetical protein